MKRKPKIVCLCGSTKFWQTFQRQGLKETLEGNIVLSIGAASGTDEDHFGNLSEEEYNKVKKDLDELHFKKIDLADEVLILNVNNYIGESTARELVYARLSGKKVRFLEPSGRKMERIALVETEVGSFVYSAEGARQLEDITLLLSEGGNGESITVTIYEVEEGFYDKLPLD